MNLNDFIKEGVVDPNLFEKDPETYRKVLRHSTAHVMAKAIVRLYPGTQLAIGPDIENGFYYDVLLPEGKTLTDQDLETIEREMKKIIDNNEEFSQNIVPIETALNIFSDQKYKKEIIQAILQGQASEEFSSELEAKKDTVSIYKTGEDFIDLCKGPHVKQTGYLKYFKLLRVSGAYWRGNEKNDQLQRIYGTVWESEERLNAYIYQLQEAQKRDHRKLAKQLDLFSFPKELGAGLVLFHPKGALIRKLIEDFSYQEHLASGYLPVWSPHIGKEILFETSGHLKWYKESMFPRMEVEGAGYYLKPMNCPFHILIYASKARSYKELPMRLFEVGTVYRYERSGVLHGMSRLRGFTQDDSHIFVAHQQLEAELESLVNFVIKILKTFGLADFYAELSTRPEKFVGEISDWERAEGALKSAAINQGLDFSVAEGQGAFYAPKLDIHLKDAIGRAWQCSTIQVDFQEPVRFDLKYVSSENSDLRPYMIHRALFGSMERFLSILLEHFAGNLPTWLAPTQVRILPVSSDHTDYAKELYSELINKKVRADVVLADEPLGARVRDAKLEKIPYVLVVGGSDIVNKTVGINARGKDRPIRDVPFKKFIELILFEINEKLLEVQAF